MSDVLSLHGLAGRNLLGLNLWPDTHYMHNLFGSALSNYTPADLFAAGEQGAWYDPSDMSTLFQDAAGTTPVTAVEQFVGLMLDKSKGLVLGPELVTIPSISLTGASLSIGPALVAGKTYQVSFTVSDYTGTGDCGFDGTTFVATTGVTRLSGNGTARGIVIAAGGPNIGLFARVTNSATFSNISVRELPGNHASQSTSTARPRLSARVNLLTNTEAVGAIAPNAPPNWSIDQPYGGINLTEIASGSFTDGRGALQFRVVGTTSIVNRLLWTCTFPTRPAVVAGANYRFQWSHQLAAGSIPNSIQANFLWLDSSNGFISISLGAVSTPSSSITTVVDFATAPAGAVAVLIRFDFVNQPNIGTAVDFTYRLGCTDLRVANTGVNLPPYQRVNTSTDYDTVGFHRYLAFDGVDDFMSTGNINFTGTDKMTVWAGVRKIANGGMILEATADASANNGAIWLYNGTPSYEYASRGSIFVNTAATPYAPPTTNVVTGISSISTDVATIRINGVQAASSTADQGTGNYGNYPMFIGSRAGTSLRFNGHLYSLIIRGAATNAAQLANTDAWVNTRTGAY